MTRRKFGMRITAGGELLDEEEILEEEEQDAPAPAGQSQFESRLWFWITAMSVAWMLSCAAAAIETIVFHQPALARVALAEGIILGILVTRYHERRLWPTI